MELEYYRFVASLMTDRPVTSHSSVVHTTYANVSALPFDPCQSPMMPKMDLIAELKKRQVKPQVKDGALEDIITGMTNHYG